MTRKVTILEALAEIKLIDSKIGSQGKFIVRNLCRPKSLVDPLESNPGGSVAAIAEAMQSISDLQANLVEIRKAINTANQVNSITVEGVTDTIANWIVWKREVVPVRNAFFNDLISKIQNERQRTSSRFSQAGNLHDVLRSNLQPPEDIIVHLDEVKLQKDYETLQTMVERLDGLLTLVDATIQVNIP